MDYDYLFKLVITGSSSVGKTCLLHRFMDDEFLSVGIPTVGLDFRIKQFEIDGEKVKIQIWDSAGQERFQCLARQYYRNANALCLVYDISDFASFERTSDWLREFQLYASDKAPKYLVGNKTDLELKRQVTRSVAEDFAKRHGLEFFETSAKTGEHVAEMFNTVAQTLLSRSRLNELQPLVTGRPDSQRRQLPRETRTLRLTEKLHSSCCSMV